MATVTHAESLTKRVWDARLAARRAHAAGDAMLEKRLCERVDELLDQLLAVAANGD